jgi:hypothetical protein
MLLRIVTFGLALVIAAPAFSAELLMFEEDGCVWCARWEAEVAPYYPDSPQGHFAPLKRYDLKRDPLPDDLQLKGGVRYTPTFVLIDKNREVGRILGYPGEDVFWKRLNGLIARVLPDEPQPLDAAALPVPNRSSS